MKFHIYKSNFILFYHSMDSTEHDGQEMLIQDESVNSDRPSEIIASMEEKFNQQQMQALHTQYAMIGVKMTQLYRKLENEMKERRKSSGIAAELLEGGRTAHS